MEGAAHNLPDQLALCAANEILAVCREAREGEVVVAVISGGGSALLPCPVHGVTLEEKRMVTIDYNTSHIRFSAKLIHYVSQIFHSITIWSEVSAVTTTKVFLYNQNH